MRTQTQWASSLRSALSLFLSQPQFRSQQRPSRGPRAVSSSTKTNICLLVFIEARLVSRTAPPTPSDRSPLPAPGFAPGASSAPAALGDVAVCG